MKTANKDSSKERLKVFIDEQSKKNLYKIREGLKHYIDGPDYRGGKSTLELLEYIDKKLGTQ